MTDTAARLPDQIFLPSWSESTEFKPNTAVSYMYRDASNYKQHLEVVLEGKMTLEQAIHICGLLDQGEYFRPELIGLDIAEWSSNGGGGHYGDDHDWHELSGIQPTRQEADGPTVAEFIAAFEAGHGQGWIVGHATKWTLKVEGRRDRLYKAYITAFNKASVEAVPYRIIPPLTEITAYT